MGLDEDLNAIAPSSSRPAALLWDRVTDAMDENDRAAFLRAIADSERVSATALCKVLREHGFQVSPSTVRAWRRGEARS